MPVLSQLEIESFTDKGYLYCLNVFSEEDALKMQDENWNELDEEFGISKMNRDTWRIPPHSPRKAK